jgi:hypothetical protein
VTLMYGRVGFLCAVSIKTGVSTGRSRRLTDLHKPTPLSSVHLLSDHRSLLHPDKNFLLDVHVHVIGTLNPLLLAAKVSVRETRCRERAGSTHT